MPKLIKSRYTIIYACYTSELICQDLYEFIQTVYGYGQSVVYFFFAAAAFFAGADFFVVVPDGFNDDLVLISS